jgi:hypothetical protein
VTFGGLRGKAADNKLIFGGKKTLTVENKALFSVAHPWPLKINRYFWWSVPGRRK